MINLEMLKKYACYELYYLSFNCVSFIGYVSYEIDKEYIDIFKSDVHISRMYIKSLESVGVCKNIEDDLVNFYK